MNREFIKRHYIKLITWVILAAYLVCGLLVVGDYGLSVDEPTQRNHSLVNYNYVRAVLTGKDVPANEQALANYENRYYGVALQLPMYHLEFTNPEVYSDNKNLYTMRHTFTFLVWFAACVAFYLLLLRDFKSDKLALIGLLMLILMPRLFADSFYNIKDSLFAALFMISLLAAFNYLKKRSLPSAALLGVAAAFCANSRIIGIIVLLGAVALALLHRYVGRGEMPFADSVPPRTLCYYLLPFAAFFAVFTLITPASWTSPLTFLYDALVKFSNFDSWSGRVLFMGELIEGQTPPWYYLPVWMGVTIPILYLVFFLLGLFDRCKDIIATWRKKFTDVFNSPFELLVLGLFVLPILFAMLFQSTLYNGWRHFYFAYPLIVLIAVYGLRYLYALLTTKRRQLIATALVAVNFSYIGVWMAAAHPYQNVYFNEFARAVAGQSFERDYWQLAARRCAEALTAMYPEHTLVLIDGKPKYAIKSTASYMLGKEARKNLKFTMELEEANALIADMKNMLTNDFEVEGFHEVYAIWVDGYKIAAALIRDQDTP